MIAASNLYLNSKRVLFHITQRYFSKMEATQNLITEGNAKIWEHEYTNNGEVKQEAFYNRVQIFNRDLSILTMQTFAEKRKLERGDKFTKLNYLDAFTASGLRALRAKKELSEELFEGFTGCDLSTDAISNLKKNLELNGLSILLLLIEGAQDINVVHEDCNVFMGSTKNGGYFDIVDIDPYGTAIPFIGSAMRAISGYGMLCVTCTDTRVLAGHDFTKCFYQYGASRAKMTCFEENALRITLATISRIANEHQKAIKPLISFHRNFYLRVFVQVVNKKSLCWESLENTGLMFYCKSCSNSHIHTYGEKLCEGRAGYKLNQVTIPSAVCNVCDGKWELNGPIWTAPINDFDFVRDTLYNVKALAEGEKIGNLNIKSTKEIQGLLESIIEEDELKNEPVVWNMADLYRLVKTRNAKKILTFSALVSAGYKVCNSYCHPGGLKTNAPTTVLYELARAWKIKESEAAGQDMMVHIPEESPGFKIMQRVPENMINLDDINEEVKQKHKDKPSNFFPNPEPNWGPKKAANIVVEDHRVEKKLKME